ncbi:type II secretion system GspH family protein [Patescibacteria group bacterium]|nr:type II secretion system GspH family protein [Patescibacteria group bacterium]
MKIFKNNNKGFSVIELVAVLVIIGVVSAVAVPKIISTVTATDVIGQTAVIKSQLSYAQSLAMNSDLRWGICCDGTDYWLFQDGNTANKVTLPGEDSDTVNLADKNISMAAFTVSFDIWGVPFTDASATTVQVGDRTITVSSPSGSETGTITITQNTGLIS